MDHAACKRCHSGMTDLGVLCHPCTTHLQGRLSDVPVLLQQLDITLTRQGSRTTSAIPAGPAGSVHPDLTISDISGQLRAACAGWAHALDGHVGRRPWAHLIDNLDKVRLHDWAVTLDRDLTRRSITAWQRIDKPPERWYAGVCSTTCAHVLWTSLDDTEITCPRCKTVWQIAERRDALIRAAEDFEGNATVVASVASYVTRNRVAPSTVRSWSFRGLLTPRSRAVTNYRVGDVIDLALRHEAKVS